MRLLVVVSTSFVVVVGNSKEGDLYVDAGVTGALEQLCKIR